MNPKAKRIVRYDQTSPGNTFAVWDDGQGNRWLEAVEIDYELVW